MNSAAQPLETEETYLATGTDGASVLQRLAAERLASHRSRRAVVEGRAAQARREQALLRAQARVGAAPAPVAPANAARVRDAVAARYLQSPSYREFLAAEAQRALEQAQAEAEVAARSAKAVIAAQQQLLDEIAQWNQPGPAFEQPGALTIVQPKAERSAGTRKRQPDQVFAPMELSVRMHEGHAPGPRADIPHAHVEVAMGGPDELADLDEEIEFRRAPEFAPLDLETQTIQANIIEFPRQLVAPRKVRPRLAEGPLLEEVVPEPQLRIFEVEPEQIAAEPEVAVAPAAPEWQSLRLGSGTAAQTYVSAGHIDAASAIDPPIYAASASRRVMSAVVDALILSGSVAVAGAVAIKVADLSLRAADLPVWAVAAVGALAVFAVLYRLLFFTLNEATPGMRATRIAFCTFDEETPKRKFMRRRLLATLLAACPLGLGLVWSVLDSDGLGWHDRMSRMYPRKY